LPASRHGLLTVPADWARNLSVLARFPVRELRQRPRPADLRAVERPAHYVTFLVTDGDNVQWQLNDFATSERWFGSPLRGRFPVGWTTSPTLAELAPTVLRWLYAQATPQDTFLAGPSGRGYFYPSEHPDLAAEAERLDKALAHSGLDAVFIIDIALEGFSPEVLGPYARQPSVAGGFWAWYGDYAARRGETLVVEGKSFVAVRFNLWEGFHDPASLARAINALPADPFSPQGYTVVAVHPWSMGLEEVRDTIDLLAPHVAVVGPNELLGLVREHLGP
ncbi:MAG: hypothetical protein Q8N53_04025, partial [Longimicrobiales bacterium]|nr:hypothetical protein [Longimicrobiales bacterium]